MDRKTSNCSEGEKAEEHLFFVMTHASAIGFGFLAAFLYSMRDIPDDVTLEFSAGTVVLFVIGWVVGWLFWRVMRRLALKSEARE